MFSKPILVAEPKQVMNLKGTCQGARRGMPEFFQTAEIARFVEMPEKRLTKFVESPGYGIRPSIRAKAGKGSPRLYSRIDLLKIALTWWLFQAGFRSQVIERVLNSPKMEKLLLDSRHWKREDAKRYLLVVKREMSDYEPSNQSVVLASPDEVAAVLHEAQRHAFQVLPIGHLLVGLWDRMRVSEGGTRGTV
jgi:hypothetical protein